VITGLPTRRRMHIPHPGRGHHVEHVVRPNPAAGHDRRATTPNQLGDHRSALDRGRCRTGRQHPVHTHLGQPIQRGQRINADIDRAMKGELPPTGRRDQRRDRADIHHTANGQHPGHHTGRTQRDGVRDIGHHRIDFRTGVSEIATTRPNHHVHPSTSGHRGRDQAVARCQAADQPGRTQLDPIAPQRVRRHDPGQRVNAQFDIHLTHQSPDRSGDHDTPTRPAVTRG
jgi:hypothetical protein